MWASLRWRSGDERHDGGTDGRQAWSRRRSVDLFSPPRSFETTELEEGEGEHCHERMAVKSLPGSPFEVVEPQLLFFSLLDHEQAHQEAGSQHGQQQANPVTCARSAAHIRTHKTKKGTAVITSSTVLRTQLGSSIVLKWGSSKNRNSEARVPVAFHTA